MLPAKAGVIPQEGSQENNDLSAPREGGGDPKSIYPHCKNREVLPAKAGVILMSANSVGIIDSAPRESGGDPRSYGSNF